MFEGLDNLLLVHVFVSHRIDHLLGKDLIENLTVLRFSNLVFEPLWSRTYIRNVQVHFKAHFDICFTILYIHQSCSDVRELLQVIFSEETATEIQGR